MRRYPATPPPTLDAVIRGDWAISTRTTAPTTTSSPVAKLIAAARTDYDELASQAPFTAIGRTVTQSDFPNIVEGIRQQNRAEFGDRADRPD
jgi:hypothetical protein